MPAQSRNILVLLWLMLAAGMSAALAQAPDEIGKKLDGLAIILDTIETRLQREGVSDDELRKARDQAIDIASAANEIAVALQPKIAELTERRDALLPDKPADPGAPDAEPTVEEPATLLREREEIEKALAFEEGLAKRAKAIATRANQLAAHAAGIERDRFTRRIFQHDQSIIDPRFWRTSAADLPVAWTRVEFVFGSMYERFVSRGALAVIPMLLFLLSIAIVAFTRPLHFFGDWFGKLLGHSQPTEVSRAVVAILVALVVMIAPVGGLYLARIFAIGLDLAAPSLLALIGTAIMAVLAITITTGIAHAILAPNRPEWRLAVAGQADAESLSRYVQWCASVAALGIFLNGAAAVANVPQSTIALVDAVICLIFAWLLWLTLKPLRSILISQSSGEETSRIRFSRLMRLYALFASAGIFLVAGGVLVGFIPLAWFLVRQFVWVGIILATYGLLSNLIDAYGSGLRSDGGEPGRIARFSGLSDRTVTQFSVVVLGVAKIFLASVALVAVAAPWGLKSDSFIEQTRLLLSGFQVGELVISPLAIIEAAAIFFGGLILTRSIRAWVGDRLLPTTTLDPGLKNSITTTAGYLGFIVSVVVAFGFIGIDLSQLGLVAGALSVGIGFGLQSIVNNFVSGLILLAERPIKAGDWIIVGGEEGTVRKINVRATELQTFDRATVVIPNSDLISGTVRNWVLGGSLGRASLVVGVGYNSDPDQVRDILLACANDHDLVLADPEPTVFFLDFGDSALLFRLDTYLADISNGFRTRSDLRFEILRRFRDARIEIPFPQRDLNIRNTDELHTIIDRFKG